LFGFAFVVCLFVGLGVFIFIQLTIQNLKIAQEAAERYFSLKKYITPAEIKKLDENSMVIYVSKFYYGASWTWLRIALQN